MKVLLILIVFANVTSISADCSNLNYYNVTDSEIQKIKTYITKMTDFTLLGSKDTYAVPRNTEELILTADEILQNNGIDLTEHSVTLPGGQTLSLFRISIRRPGPVVFLMHGLFGSHEDWILAGKNGLAYYLANEGFDVWMGNARGNKYFRERDHRDANCKEFWHFSWDEMARYDLSASIDYVLESTGRKTMIFVGHSQGFTSAIVLLSEFKQYNHKISLLIALAPLTFLSNSRSPLFRMFSLQEDDPSILKKAVGLQEFVPNEILTNSLKNVLCDNGNLTQYVCKSFMFQLCGFNIDNLDIPNLPLIMKRYPSRGSSRTLMHYAQILASGEFRRYDYGQNENLNIYGSLLPPVYFLENVTTPVIMFYSNNDWISNNTDVEMMIEKLRKVVSSIIIDGYSHLDFIFASNVKLTVYSKVLGLIRKYKKYWRSI